MLSTTRLSPPEVLRSSSRARHCPVAAKYPKKCELKICRPFRLRILPPIKGADLSPQYPLRDVTPGKQRHHSRFICTRCEHDETAKPYLMFRMDQKDNNFFQTAVLAGLGLPILVLMSRVLLYSGGVR
jgi:hypothetical protein